MLKRLTLGYMPIGNGDSITPFNDVFAEKLCIRKRSDIDLVDAVVFWGGTDIHPAIYGKKHHPTSQASRHGMSDRDVFELACMTYCKSKNIPIIGVCRGAQLMCAFEGGTLVQHVSGHTGGSHAIEVTMPDGSVEVTHTTSAHHQMMNPQNTNHVVLGVTYAPSHRSQFYQGEDTHDKIECMYDNPEPEIIYFPDCKGLAIQGHPEWHDPTDRFAQMCNLLIKHYLLKETVSVPA